MHFEDVEIANSNAANNQKRVFGVIVLTDNRQAQSGEKQKLPNFRSSAFKETELDASQFAISPQSDIQDEKAFFELYKRVAYLEARVEALSKNRVLDQNDADSGAMLKKKKRRKFKELVRDQQCPFCRKFYGSDTALKYHLKLKHSNQSNHSQVK